MGDVPIILHGLLHTLGKHAAVGPANEVLPLLHTEHEPLFRIGVEAIFKHALAARIHRRGGREDRDGLAGHVRQLINDAGRGLAAADDRHPFAQRERAVFHLFPQLGNREHTGDVGKSARRGARAGNHDTVGTQDRGSAVVEFDVALPFPVVVLGAGVSVVVLAPGILIGVVLIDGANRRDPAGHHPHIHRASNPAQILGPLLMRRTRMPAIDPLSVLVPGNQVTHPAKFHERGVDTRVVLRRLVGDPGPIRESDVLIRRSSQQVMAVRPTAAGHPISSHPQWVHRDNRGDLVPQRFQHVCLRRHGHSFRPCTQDNQRFHCR